jgi:type IV pilus biogenesis protein CpaD/CtpE
MRATTSGLRWGLAALAVAAAGCARPVRVAGDADPAATTPPAPAPDVNVVVENHNSSDVVVTLQSASGRRIRLGSVSSATTRTLRFSAELAAGSQSLVLVAHPIGARESYVSERFTLQRGQDVVLTVASRIGQSSLALR